MSAPPGVESDPNPISDRLPAGESYVGIPRSAIGIPGVIAAILVALGISVIGVIIVAAVDPSIGDADADQSDWGMIALQASLAGGFLLAAIGATAIANEAGVRDAFGRLGLRRFGPNVIPWMFAAVGIYFLASIVIAITLTPEQEDIAENLGADQDAALIVTIIAGILIVPVTAIAEEVFFRGLIFGGFRQRMGLWPAALLSGVLFGAGHLTAGDAAVALQLSVFGVVLAWVYERTGVLWVPIILHGLNNSLAFYLLVTDKI
jgi:membrane protease YdiL (CAAX protease family)